MKPTIWKLSACLLSIDDRPMPPSESTSSDEFVQLEDLANGAEYEVGAGGFMSVSLDSTKAVKLTVFVSQDSPHYGWLSAQARDFLDDETESEFKPINLIGPNGDEYVEPYAFPTKRAINSFGKKAQLHGFEFILPRPSITYGDE